MVRYTGGTKNGVKRLSNDYQRYLSNKKGTRKERHINQFNYLTIKYLLADAEILENIGEDFVGSDFSGDFSEVMHGFAYVLRE